MRVRRLRKQAAHLEITAFINLIVVLVPFLLSTAVFTRLAVMDLTLPAAAPAALQALDTPTLQLVVTLRTDAVEVADRSGGLIQRIPRADKGNGSAAGADFKALGALMLQVKARFPQVREATLLAEADTPYDDIVQAMDAMRSSVTAQGAKVQRSELFPQIALGDAPAAQAPAPAVKGAR